MRIPDSGILSAIKTCVLQKIKVSPNSEHFIISKDDRLVFLNENKASQLAIDAFIKSLTEKAEILNKYGITFELHERMWSFDNLILEKITINAKTFLAGFKQTPPAIDKEFNDFLNAINEVIAPVYKAVEEIQKLEASELEQLEKCKKSINKYLNTQIENSTDDPKKQKSLKAATKEIEYCQASAQLIETVKKIAKEMPGYKSSLNRLLTLYHEGYENALKRLSSRPFAESAESKTQELQKPELLIAAPAKLAESETNQLQKHEALLDDNVIPVSAESAKSKTDGLQKLDGLLHDNVTATPAKSAEAKNDELQTPKELLDDDVLAASTESEKSETDESQEVEELFDDKEFNDCLTVIDNNVAALAKPATNELQKFEEEEEPFEQFFAKIYEKTPHGSPTFFPSTAAPPRTAPTNTSVVTNTDASPPDFSARTALSQRHDC